MVVVIRVWPSTRESRTTSESYRDYRRVVSGDSGHRSLLIVARLVLRRWHVADRLKQSARVPLLERASLEEDDELRRIWSQMLANAAAKPRGHAVQPAFIHILEELSPLEVHVLAWVAENGTEGDGIWALVPEDVAAHFQVEAGELAIMKDNLQRLNLITRPLGIIPVRASVDVDTGEYWGPMYLTALGYAFMNACSGKLLFQGGC